MYLPFLINLTLSRSTLGSSSYCLWESPQESLSIAWAACSLRANFRCSTCSSWYSYLRPPLCSRGWRRLICCVRTRTRHSSLWASTLPAACRCCCSSTISTSRTMLSARPASRTWFRSRTGADCTRSPAPSSSSSILPALFSAFSSRARGRSWGWGCYWSSAGCGSEKKVWTGAGSLSRTRAPSFSPSQSPGIYCSSRSSPRTFWSSSPSPSRTSRRSSWLAS